MKKKGRAIIFSAPSGSGKTTIVRHLLDNNTDLDFSISACTRDKRGRKEVSGRDYYFYSQQEFKQMIDADAFVEWEEVYEGNFYGTLKREIERIWREGKNIIFDVDVKGGLNLKNYFGACALSVFVKVPSMDELKVRLERRNTDTEASISQRLFKAEFEMRFEEQFDVTLVNAGLDESLQLAQKLYDDFKQKPLTES